MKKLLTIVALVLPLVCSAQTGGGYDVSHSNVHGSGRSSGGQFTVDGTIGQAGAGTVSSEAPFSMRSGFWAFGPFAPTAAHVSISGRVAKADGAGVKGVYLRLLAPDGSVRQALSSSFGYFRFESVEAGRTYILSAHSSRWGFTQPAVAINLDSDIAGVDFIAVSPH